MGLGLDYPAEDLSVVRIDDDPLVTDGYCLFGRALGGMLLSVRGVSMLSASAESGRFARVDLSGVLVRQCENDFDSGEVERIRSAAFSRLLARRALVPQSWLDAADLSDGTLLLLGHARSGEAIATLRVQDGRAGPLELTRHVSLHQLSECLPRAMAQFARLAAVRHPEAMDVMFGLFKAAWQWCFRNGLEQIVIATPPWTRPIYDHLCFEDAGDGGRFRHPVSTRGLHSTMHFGVQTAERRWRSVQHPHCRQFFEEDHPLLHFWARSPSNHQCAQPSPSLRPQYERPTPVAAS